MLRITSKVSSGVLSFQNYHYLSIISSTCMTCNHRVIGRFASAGFTMNKYKYRRLITELQFYEFVQFIDVKPMFVWERLAVVSLVFISHCVSLPSSLDGKFILKKYIKKLNKHPKKQTNKNNQIKRYTLSILIGFL